MNALFFLTLSALTCFSCLKHNPQKQQVQGKDQNLHSSTMKIIIGPATFTATLYENPTATAFRKMLPITLNMSELNNNEQYAQLPADLPVHPAKVDLIQAGDIMIWGENTLVVFYQSFSTSYQYTKVGKINEVEGLVAALDKKSVIIRYELP